jgi:hypothetical protein
MEVLVRMTWQPVDRSRNRNCSLFGGLGRSDCVRLGLVVVEHWWALKVNVCLRFV